MATITISKTELLNRLQSVSKIIPSKCTMPIMENVLLDIQDGTIKLSAVDYQGRINTTIEGILTDNNISICIEPKLLINALKTLPEQPLVISITESFLRQSSETESSPQIPSITMRIFCSEEYTF